MTIPQRLIDPKLQMHAEALGTAPHGARLKGRHVLVVGAGQRANADPDTPVGNGRAMALLAAREGAAVVCADISAEAVRETVAQIQDEGGVAHASTVDVANPSEISAMVSGAHRTLGSLDGVLLSVGISYGKPLESITPELWDHEHAVNLRSHMLVCQAALPIMEPGSSIVLISSLASLRAGGRNPAYETSKAGQLALARNVALAGQPRGIRCNVVAPGLIDTPMGRDATKRRPDRAVAVPFGRQGTGWEIAYVALFFLSNESSYVNGQTLYADGGLSSGIAFSSNPRN